MQEEGHVAAGFVGEAVWGKLSSNSPFSLETAVKYILRDRAVIKLLEKESKISWKKMRLFPCISLSVPLLLSNPAHAFVFKEYKFHNDQVSAHRSAASKQRS